MSPDFLHFSTSIRLTCVPVCQIESVPSTTTWANLGSLGASHDAVRGSVSGNAQGEWSEKGYVFKGANYFTAGGPATTNIGNHAYTCTGYCVETWDAAASTWTSPVVTAGTTCTLTGTAGGANRRVTWLWTLSAQGLRAASDYDVSDYVQTGLVGHFDGICNEGADMPHGNQKTALWRNLATDGPDARCPSGDIFRKP